MCSYLYFIGVFSCIVFKIKMLHNYYSNYRIRRVCLAFNYELYERFWRPNPRFFSTRGKDNLTDRNEERLPNYAALYTKEWITNEREEEEKKKKKRGGSNAIVFSIMTEYRIFRWRFILKVSRFKDVICVYFLRATASTKQKRGTLALTIIWMQRAEYDGLDTRV